MKWRDYQQCTGRRYWKSVLKRNNYCVAAAAREAGTNRTNTYELLKRYGIEVSRTHTGTWKEFGL